MPAIACSNQYMTTTQFAPHRGGYDSSGSEHEPTTSSLDSFSLLFDDDIVTELETDPSRSDREDGDDHRDLSNSSSIPSAAIVHDLLNPPPDRYRTHLLTHVTDAADRLDSIRSNRPTFQRAIMASLRESGYNAGLCKARWDAGDGITAGSYEYIDVVRSGGARYIIDVDFASEFEIARPTAEYGRVVAELPTVFVGRAEELRSVVRIVAEAVKRSLRSRDMHVPPWRKLKYMRAKWLGAYKRTTGGASGGGGSSVPVPTCKFSYDEGGALEVRCRAVGFLPAQVMASR